MKDGLWFLTAYSSENADKYGDSIEIKFGDTAELSFINCSDMLDEVKMYFDNIKNGSYEDIIDEYEFSRISFMTFDEFLKDILNIAHPKSGDLCRIYININDSSNSSEYVYFEMP